MDCCKCQLLVGRLPQHKGDLYAWLNRNVTSNHHHNVAMERRTGKSGYFQQGISNVLAKQHLQRRGFPNHRMNRLEESNLNDINN